MPTHTATVKLTAKQLAKITSTRRKLDLTQTALAAKCDLTPAMISQIESRKKQPSFGTLSRIAKALGLTAKVVIQ